MSAPILTPWPNTASPTREALEAVLREEGIAATWWSNAPMDRYSPHSHAYHKVLYCARGGITFIVPEAGEFRLHPGDRLDIPPGLVHSAIVGPEGVTCVEAPRETA
ncbi:MAG TPA: AraC family ligand binding domain-containing protein [Dehalococcoidia bacterium]|nr:AraC family ligand binding domain-containing protein [Dehalococcoidia bacterium]